MRERYTLGSTVRLYLDLISSGSGVVSQTPAIGIQRKSNGQWLGSDGEWYTTPPSLVMQQLDATFFPGRYYFDFDQALDEAAGSEPEYLVKMSATTPATLVYRDLVFGKMPGTAALELCAIQGTIASAQGAPICNALVRATVQPIYRDALGRTVQVDTEIKTYSDTNGDFELALVRGAVVRLEIDAVGYDRKFEVPDQASAIFTEL